MSDLVARLRAALDETERLALAADAGSREWSGMVIEKYPAPISTRRVGMPERTVTDTVSINGGETG